MVLAEVASQAERVAGAVAGREVVPAVSSSRWRQYG